METYNDHTETTGGMLISKASPRDDVVKMDESHDDYLNILTDNVRKDIQESGRFSAMQQKAMNQTSDAISKVISTTVKNVDVNIEFY